MKEIRHFMGHYVVWPVKRKLRRNAKTVKVSEEDLTNFGIITDGRGGLWDAQCPSCLQDTMEVIGPGEAQCAECAFAQVLT